MHERMYFSQTIMHEIIKFVSLKTTVWAAYVPNIKWNSHLHIPSYSKGSEYHKRSNIPSTDWKSQLLVNHPQRPSNVVQYVLKPSYQCLWNFNRHCIDQKKSDRAFWIIAHLSRRRCIRRPSGTHTKVFFWDWCKWINGQNDLLPHSKIQKSLLSLWVAYSWELERRTGE